MQGWQLRRLVSVFNLAARRPHLPKEQWLRHMMVDLNIDIKSKKPRDPNPEVGDSEEDCLEEGGEEECGTDDECLEARSSSN